MQTDMPLDPEMSNGLRPLPGLEAVPLLLIVVGLDHGVVLLEERHRSGELDAVGDSGIDATIRSEALDPRPVP